MEKKQNLRTNQVPAKVLSSDSRKSNQGKQYAEQFLIRFAKLSFWAHNYFI